MDAIRYLDHQLLDGYINWKNNNVSLVNRIVYAWVFVETKVWEWLHKNDVYLRTTVCLLHSSLVELTSWLLLPIKFYLKYMNTKLILIFYLVNSSSFNLLPHLIMYFLSNILDSVTTCLLVGLLHYLGYNDL